MSYISYDDWGELAMKAVLRFTQGNRELDLVQEYTVHPYDQVLRLYYAKARMYDAAERRFAAGDPVKGSVANPLTLVQYLYVLDNPLKYIDPWGLEYGAIGVYATQKEIIQKGNSYYVALSDLEKAYNVTGVDVTSALNIDRGNLTIQYAGWKYNQNLGSHGGLTAETVDVFFNFRGMRVSFPGGGSSPFITVTGEKYMPYEYFAKIMCLSFGRQRLGFEVSNPKTAQNLTEEEKMFIATIFGETSVSSNAAGIAVANVIMNRLNPKLDKKGYWTKYTTVSGIIMYTGFDAYRQNGNPNSNYSQAKKYMDNPKAFNGYVNIPKFVDVLIKLCLPVYYGTVPDITDGSVYYYSPNAQAALHSSNPSQYKASPDFLQEPVVKVQIKELSPNDDFAFYKYK